MPPILEEIAVIAGCDYDFINNAIRRNYLTTELPAVRPGVARNFTRANALEIAFLRALVDIGNSPSVASAIAERWISLNQPANWVHGIFKTWPLIITFCRPR